MKKETLKTLCHVGGYTVELMCSYGLGKIVGYTLNAVLPEEVKLGTRVCCLLASLMVSEKVRKSIDLEIEEIVSNFDKTIDYMYSDSDEDIFANENISDEGVILDEA